MKTEAELRVAGIDALIAELGTVEAERFIAALSRDRFDYTQWRRTGLPSLSISQLSAQAMVLASTIDADGATQR